MTPRVLQSIFTYQRLVSARVLPRGPNDDDDEDDEEEDDGADEDREPAVIREPDEDE